MLLFFKALHQDVFKIHAEENEKEFERKFMEFNRITGMNIHIQRDADNKSILTWESSTKMIVALPITDYAFLFSQIGTLDENVVISMKPSIAINAHERKIIEAEADSIKKLLKMLHPDAPMYCK